ncbi:hypothetical protein CesoFtcFv8_021320 [Champsocephalus esox]|uniref:Uncharacterized protein n=1 Tax=Champsocephalus esox TaxID=159716 RepID=A0AAN8BCN7_9TELE|nr:hypothetical protein CesoFtcFv8_021320 [Champsocephalus esox]
MRSDVGMAMMMQIVHLLIVSTFLLQTRCSAKELRCTVEELDGLTKYTIPKDNATGCICHWTDPNGINVNIDELENEMKEQSKWTFPSEVCYNQLHFSGTCLSETEQNTANCTSDQQEMNNDPTKSAKEKETPRHHWTLMVPGTLFVIVPLLLAFCYRDHNSRCTSESGSDNMLV